MYFFRPSLTALILDNLSHPLFYNTLVSLQHLHVHLYTIALFTRLILLLAYAAAWRQDFLILFCILSVRCIAWNLVGFR